MKLHITATILVVSAAVAIAGLQPLIPQASTPSETIRSRTELVLVPVMVSDGEGTHVPGLKKDDFIVKENGKAQRVSVFEEVKASPEAHLERAALPAGTYSNVELEQTPKRLVIIALDTINTPMTDQTYGRQQMIKFLSDNIEPGAMVALLTVGRRNISVLHDFTTDPKVLIAALRKLRSRSEAGAGIAAQEADIDADMLAASANDIGKVAGAVSSGFERWAKESEAAGRAVMTSAQRRLLILDTLAAIQQIARAYAGVPGRKSLIWATAGFPFTIDQATSRAAMVLSPPGTADDPQAAASDIRPPKLMRQPSGVFPGQDEGIDVLPVYEKTWRVLNDGNMAIYPVDMRGLVVGTTLPASTRIVTNNPREPLLRTTRQDAQFRDTISTMRVFADMTGGRAFYNTNDLAYSFRNAAADCSAYYLLGYYLPKNSSPGWHELQVAVNRSGVHVRSRSGFFLTRPVKDIVATSKGEIQFALASPLDSTGLPLMVKLLETAQLKDLTKNRAAFRIMLPPGTVMIDESDGNHVQLAFVAVARTTTGEETASFAQTLESRLKPESAAQIREHGLTYNNTLDLTPGDYSVRFVVRDNLSGRTGSLTVPVQIK